MQSKRNREAGSPTIFGHYPPLGEELDYGLIDKVRNILGPYLFLGHLQDIPDQSLAPLAAARSCRLLPLGSTAPVIRIRAGVANSIYLASALVTVREDSS